MWTYITDRSTNLNYMAYCTEHCCDQWVGQMDGKDYEPLWNLWRWVII